MINFYGFTLKYCKPHNIIGKRVVSASVYYEEIKVFDYSFSKKDQEHSLVFVDKAQLILFNKKMKELNKKYDTPLNALGFLMRMLNYVEVEQVYKNAKKDELVGVLTLIDKDGTTINAILPIKAVDKKIEKTLLNTYASSSTKYYLQDKDFVWI